MSVRDSEDNDCAVLACSQLTGITYEESHALFKKHGRKDLSATEWDVTNAVYSELGYNLEELHFELLKEDGKPPTVRQMLVNQMLPQGRWLVYITEHVFAVIDGETDDWFKDSRYRVQHVWNITK